MSYNQGYGQGGQGYGQYNPYGEQNPYTDNNTSGGYGSPQQGAYQSSRPGGYASPQPEYGQNSYGQYQDERTQGGYEMGAMGNQPSSNPNRILDEIRQINDEVGRQEQNLDSFKAAQLRLLDQTTLSTSSPIYQEVVGTSNTSMDILRDLIQRLKRIKQDPESGHPRNAAQVGSCQRRLKACFNKYQQQEAAFRRNVEEMNKRQYKIIRPDANDDEVREALAQAARGGQLFSQALLNTDRHGQALKARDLVKARHEAMQEIEAKMIEVAQLFIDLEAMVAQQDVQVNQIDTKAQETNTDVEQATVQLDGAAEKARATRKKKWICTGIVVLIIIIIVIVVAVAVTLTRNTSNNNNNNRPA